jgi:tRNA uridine 5-carbamoylmethylation protein Kti12
MDNTLSDIYNIHIRNLKNLDNPNPKLFIFMSGVPGSGKTYLAKQLEKDLKAIRVSNREAYHVIKDDLKIKLDDYHEIIHEYRYFLLNKLKSYPNGLVIIDASIDREYENLTKWADDNDYKYFVIGIDISREEAEARLKINEPNSYKDYLLHMDKWIADHEKFNAKVKADFVYAEEKYTDLLSAIKNKTTHF